ncbi:MAG: YihY/virulence factor BrkB family protein [Anaerolineales bacterium]
MNQSTVNILRETITAWFDTRTSELAAALSFFLIFSLAPILHISIFIAGFFYGEQAAEGEIVAQTEDVIGTEAARAIQGLLAGAYNDPTSGTIATLFSLGFLVFASVRFFLQLQRALNYIWHVESRDGDNLASMSWQVVRKRLVSFGIVILLGVFLLLILIVNSIVPAIVDEADNIVPAVDILSQIINWAVALALLTLALAMIYKILPDARIAWQDVWLGAFITAVLVLVGNFFIGLYLQYGSTTSAFGAAGSFIALMLWAFYTSQVAFVGAKFTQVYAEHRGRGIQPDKNAVRVKRVTVDEPAGS